MTRRKVVLLGELGAVEPELLEAIEEAGCAASSAASWPEARAAIGAEQPLALVLAASHPGLEELCIELRADLEHDALPLIALAESAWDPALGRLFALTIDDFVAADDPASLAPKLTALGEGDPYAGVPSGLGRVLVADPDRGRRVLYGRLLRRKGFDVDFAVDAADLVRVARRSDDVRLVLALRGLPPDGALATRTILEGSGEASGSVPWILLSGPGEPDVDLAGEPPAVRVLSWEGPPDDVLFLANDLLSSAPTNLRASPRLLYGAPATFVVPGRARGVASFTYNVNRTGLYLRTTAPPPMGTAVEIELRPPFGRGRAALAARVVWRKQANVSSGPVVPPGFGVVYTEVPIADGAALEAGYDALLAREGE